MTRTTFNVEFDFLTTDQNGSDRYQLIDFGDGRKLESFAGHIIDRPSPAAEGVARRSHQLWSGADASFSLASKKWRHHTPWPDDLVVDCGAFRMPVAPTPYGHIGLFPEQFDNWKWLTNFKSNAVAQRSALNLFAYTGASTMALVAAGYQVAHVDAAKPNVALARQAARHNGWQDAPIRYLVDDAAKFAAREVRRSRAYQTIVLDPPAYGHSPQGKAWRIERDLWPLLEDCLRLMNPANFRLLVTGHSPEVDETDVCEFLKETEFFRTAPADSALLLASGRSQLVDRHRRMLDAGFFVRVSSQPTV